jgi:serine/threonine protein kinase
MSKHKYLSSGTYGCVLKPAIPCKKQDGTENKVGHNTVSKIFDLTIEENTYNKVYDEEIQVNNLLEKIDPTREFTIQKLDHCPLPEITPILAREIATHCEYFNIYKEIEDLKIKGLSAVDEQREINDLMDKYPEEAKQMAQIIYPYGGFDLSYVKTNTKKPFYYIFIAMKDVFVHGLRLLKEHEIIHQDIKPANLLYNETINYPYGKVFLIDFGLYTIKDNLYRVDKPNYYCGYPYDYFPPEYRVYDAVVNKKAVTQDIAYNGFYLLSSRIYQTEDMQSMPLEIQKLLYIYDKKKITYINKLLTYAKTQDFEETLRNQYDKVNVYMLGVSLLEIFISKYKTLSNIRKDYTNTKFVKDITHLIEGMICFDINKRYTSEKCIEEYQKIYDKLLPEAPQMTRSKIRSSTLKKI